MSDSMFEMKSTARRCGQENYLPVEEQQLQVDLCPSDFETQTMVVTNKADQPFVGVLEVEMTFACKEPRFFMPAFMYNRNRGNVEPYRNKRGTHIPFPRLSLNLERKGYSDYWMVRSDRLSHPVSMAVDGGKVYGISVQPTTSQGCIFNGFTCHLGKEESSVGITLGYENAPILYIQHEDSEERKKDISGSSIVLQPGESLSVQLQLFYEDAVDERSINRIIRQVYSDYHQEPRKGAAISETVNDVATAICEDAYLEDMAAYSTQVFLKDGKIEYNPIASISWTGGVEVASPMLYCAARLKNEKMRRQALEVVEKVVKKSLNPSSGLPYDAYDGDRWYTQGWWDSFLKESGHSSYLVGQALYYVLLAYEIEDRFYHTVHSEWLEWAKGCLDRIELTKDDNGEVPHIWSAEDGHALDYDSFSGCWCAAAAAYYDKLTKTARYTAGCEKSAAHYYETYMKHMECYGTPHDTQKAVDSEGSLAFIKLSRFLHELTGEEKYIRMLSDALEYEFTFKFCWNPPIQVDPLKRIGWSCCGGSVTSTCNPHIHPMSNNVCEEILYCYEQTGDSYFEKRLEDTVKWGLQTYSRYDGEYDYGKKGWMSERFCHSEGLLIETYEDGSPCSTWKCFLPWGASNILEGLCGKIWDEFIEKNCGER